MNPRTKSINHTDVATASPLSWWRETPPQHLGHSQMKALRRHLVELGILGDEDWPRAARGDAAAAIAVAIRVIWNPSASRDLLDIAMSAVVVVALDGDAAARDVLAHALRRRIGTTRANELADKWAMLTFEEMRGSADPQKRRDKRRAYRPRWGRRLRVVVRRECQRPR